MQPVQYVTDTNGKPIYVQVPVAQDEKLIADAEELADIAAYRKAKAKQRKTVAFDAAFAEVEAHHTLHVS